MSAENFNLKVHGHVHIVDKVSGEVLLDKKNAIHNKNMAIAIARGLSNTSIGAKGTHQIYYLKLGNGGASIDALNTITYQPTPNAAANGGKGALYNETYEEIVDEQSGSAGDSNSVTFQEDGDDAIIIVTMTIAAGEPSGQNASDSPPDPDFDSDYAFDELGLFTSDDFMLTHIVFSPILKTANRELVITYTLTVSVS